MIQEEVYQEEVFQEEGIQEEGIQEEVFKEDWSISRKVLGLIPKYPHPEVAPVVSKKKLGEPYLELT